MSTQSALPAFKQTATPKMTVQFTLAIERPGSPTSVDQHPIMILNEATTALPFGDHKVNGIQHITFEAIIPDTGLPAECRALIQSSAGPHWMEEHCNKFGRLAQGCKDIKGTNTMHFIPVTKVPPG
jgi:hypothetical protein